MKPLKNIAFVLEDFAVQTPAQQLLDRFLIGYPRDGKFYRPQTSRVSVHVPGDGENAELERRRKDFALIVKRSVKQTVAGADAIIVCSGGTGGSVTEELVKSTLESAPRGAACFAHGALSSSLEGAKTLAQYASSRQVALLAGTPLGVTWRLPEVEVVKGTPLKEALVVVQGKLPAAELDGLESLLPVIERRQAGESGIRGVQYFNGEDLWRAGAEGKWSWPLLASALSRSDTPQGDALKDGRTQDLVGLGLVPKLAREPRGWVIEHRDGLRSAILVLDGVVADYNFAVQTQVGRVISAQMYRPPAPPAHHFSRLVKVIENFFRTGTPPWPLERSILISGLLQVFRNHAERPSQPIETPGLVISYSV